VHVEEFKDYATAIRREKQLKGWRRSRKLALIEETNPEWQDMPQS
jgi:putative endonuclease